MVLKIRNWQSFNISVFSRWIIHQMQHDMLDWLHNGANDIWSEDKAEYFNISYIWISNFMKSFDPYNKRYTNKRWRALSMFGSVVRVFILHFVTLFLLITHVPLMLQIVHSSMAHYHSIGVIYCGLSYTEIGTCPNKNLVCWRLWPCIFVLDGVI